MSSRFEVDAEVVCGLRNDVGVPVSVAGEPLVKGGVTRPVVVMDGEGRPLGLAILLALSKSDQTRRSRQTRQEIIEQSMHSPRDEPIISPATRGPATSLPRL